MTSLARYTLRAACVTHAEPAQALRALNQALLDADTERHCTVAWCGCVARRRSDGRTWLATIALGGHPFPLVVARWPGRAGRAERVAAGHPGRTRSCMTSMCLWRRAIRLVALHRRHHRGTRTQRVLWRPAVGRVTRGHDGDAAGLARRAQSTPSTSRRSGRGTTSPSWPSQCRARRSPGSGLCSRVSSRGPGRTSPQVSSARAQFPAHVRTTSGRSRRDRTRSHLAHHRPHRGRPARVRRDRRHPARGRAWCWLCSVAPAGRRWPQALVLTRTPGGFLRLPPPPQGGGWRCRKGLFIVTRRIVVLLSTAAVLLSLTLWQPSYASSGRQPAQGCHASGGQSGAVGLHPAGGPARGRGRHPGLLDRLRGRPVLRQRLAHHRRDGRHLDAADEAARRRVVRAGRPVGRAGDDVHQRPGLHPLHLPDTAGLQVERTDFVPDGRRGVLFGLKVTNPGAARTAKLSRRRPLRADGPVPVGLHRHDPERQRQPARQGHATPGAPAVHRRRRAAQGAGPPLRRARRHLDEAHDSGRSASSTGGRSPATAAPAPSPARRPTPSRRPATTGRSATAPAAS